MIGHTILLGLAAVGTLADRSQGAAVPEQQLLGKSLHGKSLHSRRCEAKSPQSQEDRYRPKPYHSIPPPSPSPPPTRAAQCTSSYLSSVLQSYKENGVNVSLETAVPVPEGGSFGEGAKDLASTFNATQLPEVCAIIVSVKNSTANPTSNYRFGMFLPPSDTWNGRFLAVGNGAFLGGINWPYMGSGPHYGFATMSTDTGHSSGPGDLSWGLNRPDRLLDWGYRAMRGSSLVAKQVVAGYYQERPSRSYFTGCSTGGRQALKAIQGDPESWDGALIGAPAWDTKDLMPWAAKMGKSNVRPDGSLIFDASNYATGGPWQTLVAQVQLQCDAADGVVDGIVSAPELCLFDFTRFTCLPGAPQTPGCITPEQVAVVKGMYADYFLGANSTGNGDQLVMNGMQLSSETDLTGWVSYLNNPVDFVAQYPRYWIYNDTRWQLSQYSDQVVVDSRRVNPGQASADDYDLSPFKRRGGKVILYHGVADGLVPTRSTTHYYNKTREAMGGQQATDAFLRHFLVPGMNHCWFSPTWVNAPWMFAGVGQAEALQLLPPGSTPLPPPEEFLRGWGTPLFRGDVNYDALLKLVTWVENGTAPDDIRAVAYGADWNVQRTRKLCPYPKKAVLINALLVNDQAGWVCA
ncbi:hypothetical protein MCOR25_003235 [Pyricularia grisea]|uniref:Carboxylic ester hydrolase n=1 Tax=Pyricularia grisea TaxID=148305 RepID=A0A6P8B5K5_PYRGI|nr:hypothetical protein PgNI_06498 [Pyricularia grisea]KAI6374289.1 hypothetical protein MCOR25_003235 [Pyricularia grisea]TLD10535.1 hypothetical protein PgNI_06498 [Pyricularia grisea]